MKDLLKSKYQQHQQEQEALLQIKKLLKNKEEEGDDGQYTFRAQITHHLSSIPWVASKAY